MCQEIHFSLIDGHLAKVYAKGSVAPVGGLREVAMTDPVKI